MLYIRIFCLCQSDAGMNALWIVFMTIETIEIVESAASADRHVATNRVKHTGAKPR